jgi:hypothetical protein
MNARLLVVGLSLAAVLSPAFAAPAPEAAPPVTVTRKDGGMLQQKDAFGGVLFPHSTLRRTFITIHDARLPVRIEGDTGIRWHQVQFSGNWAAQVRLTVSDPVSAVDIHFLMFDYFERHLRTVSLELVEDLSVESKVFTGTWDTGPGFFGNTCDSIAYVARVRTAKGEVFEADTAAVLAEVAKLNPRRLDPAALEVKNPLLDVDRGLVFPDIFKKELK